MELAHGIDKHGARKTDHGTISRWERGVESPSPGHRAALAKIAAKHKHDGLADIFRAPTIAWRLVARLKVDIGDENVACIPGAARSGPAPWPTDRERCG